jgi:hypothetical protein
MSFFERPKRIPTQELLDRANPTSGDHLGLGAGYRKLLIMTQAEWNTETSDTRVVKLVEDAFRNSSSLVTSARLYSELIVGLWETVKRCLPNRGRKPVHAIITYPGAWKPDTMDRLNEALDLSGIRRYTTTVTLLSESHAAASAVRFDHLHGITEVRCLYLLIRSHFTHVSIISLTSPLLWLTVVVSVL